jgi:hypothetical protein
MGTKKIYWYYQSVDVYEIPDNIPDSEAESYIMDNNITEKSSEITEGEYRNEGSELI